MSKGAFNGLLKGKLGNTIFYKVTNSSDKEKQGQRLYVASIANPRTAPQATQRMRMKPAINFYRGLADLLDHSWEGVKYGALSRQKFMQLALRSDASFAIPFVTKGESRFVPGDYPISLGSISVNADIEDVVRDNSAGNPYSYAQLAGLNFSDDLAAANTWGSYSEETISRNGGALRDGDEITFVAVYEKNGVYVPRHAYFVLNTGSTEPLHNVLNRAGFLISDASAFFLAGEISGNGSTESAAVTEKMVAAGLIVSRHPNRTSTTWLRSSSNLYCSDEFKAVFMSNAALQAAIASYQTASSDLTSDWLLNQAGGDASTGSGNGSSVVRTSVANVSVQWTEGQNSVQYRTAAVLTNPTYPNGAVITMDAGGGKKAVFKVNGTAIVRQGSPAASGAVFAMNTIDYAAAQNLLSGYTWVTDDPDEPAVEGPGA